MNRVFSPINIASLIFIVITIFTIDGIRKKERNAERDKAQSELAARYQSDYQEILDETNSKLPMRLMDWLAPYVDELRLEGDTLNVICHVDRDDPYEFQYSADNPALALLNMFKDGGFGPAFVDCIMANKWAVRMINSHNQVVIEDYTFDYDALVEGYLHHYYYDTQDAEMAGEKIMLKRWVAAQQKK